MKPVKRSPFEDSILRSLRRVIRGIALYNKHLESHYDITGPQLVCLRHLRFEGPTTPSRLADAASLSKPTITGIVDRLEKRGFVQRRRSATDKRQVDLGLTERGQELAFTAPPPLQERFAQNLAMLSRAQQTQIDRTLERIVRMMEVADLDAAPILETAHAVHEGRSPRRSGASAKKRKRPGRTGGKRR